jgi:site-specific DNA-methyltransferase (adenine-specific)
VIVIHLARKPLEGTVAANALHHGTGGLNIDGSRLAVGKALPGGGAQKLWSH